VIEKLDVGRDVARTGIKVERQVDLRLFGVA